METYEGKPVTEETSELDTFDNVAEEEILCFWRLLKSGGLSGDKAWRAIVTGIALDVAFDRSKNLRRVEQ